MRIVTFTLDRLKKLNRPAGYLDDLRACAVHTSDETMSFDVDSDGYKSLLEKYRKPQKVAVQRSRGIGDTISKLTAAVGIKECGGCAKRKEMLNKLIPFKPRE